MSALRDLQVTFARLVVRLITSAFTLGYEVTLGEAHRPPETAALYAKDDRGIANSLHTDRLAIDLNLFQNGVLLAASEDYRPLGDYWKTLHERCRWGGDFVHRPDGNHFSLSPDGTRA